MLTSISSFGQFNFGVKGGPSYVNVRVIDTKGTLSPYDVINSNCIQNCTQPLAEQGILPGRFGAMVRPNVTFDAMINHFTNNRPFDFQSYQGYHHW